MYDNGMQITSLSRLHPSGWLALSQYLGTKDGIVTITVTVAPLYQILHARLQQRVIIIEDNGQTILRVVIYDYASVFVFNASHGLDQAL